MLDKNVILQSGLKDKSESTVATFKFSEVVDFVEATDFQVVESAVGKKYVHVMNDTHVIKIGVNDEKLPVPTNVPPEMLIPWLVTNGTIYGGISDAGRPWFTFSGKAEGRAIVKLTAEQLQTLLKAGTVAIAAS